MLGRNSLKGKLTKNELTIGSWVTLAHPAVAEIMADAGFDWLAVDLEHSVISLREAEELIRVIESKGISPLVRLTLNDPSQIKRVMDAGAYGVIVPMVNNRRDAEAAVSAVKYPPQGTRGVGLARAQGYGFAFDEYASEVNSQSIVVAQIEHIQAIENLPEILGVEGLDGTMVGPYDLSGSMGKPGKYEDQDVQEALLRYESISREMKKPFGYHVIQPKHQLVREKAAKGYTFIALSTDCLFLGSTCREQMAKLREGQ